MEECSLVTKLTEKREYPLLLKAIIRLEWLAHSRWLISIEISKPKDVI